MITKRDKQLLGQKLLAAFRDAGAAEIAPDMLLPAESLLDLYGEDIRARAYVTPDPIRGEMMLRPDFTVPVVQAHMENGADPARYCYLGEVFRKQDTGDTRPEAPRDNEYLQAGFELFSHEPGADAEVFALFHNLLSPYRVHSETGDMGLLLDAVRGLPLSELRREALLHHIWRAGRFQRLLLRFSTVTEPREFPETSAAWSGLRSRDEMQARIERLQMDAGAEPLPAIWTERLDHLFAIRAPASEAVAKLRDLARDWPQIEAAVGRIEARFAAIADAGVDPAQVVFDASHGRSTMEYYDGFTFTFMAEQKDWPPLASGGRYDALTSVLGKGRRIAAIGGIIRPGLLAELEAA